MTQAWQEAGQRRSSARQSGIDRVCPEEALQIRVIVWF
jgi:hypothetical protein